MSKKAACKKEDFSKYIGKYVVVSHLTDYNVLDVGDNPVTLFYTAKDNGLEEPIIYYISGPDEGSEES